MNPWREVLRSLQAELDRLSQEIDGCSVLPNGVTAVLPGARFERWAPILEAVTAELGQALVAWVEGSRRAWYAGAGPFLTVELDAERLQPEVRCQFLESGPGEKPATEEEPAGAEPAAEPGPSAAPSTEVSWEPEVRGDTEIPSPRGPSIRTGTESPLDQFELDAWPYLSGAAEPPSLAAEPADGEDGEIHLSQIELD